MRRRNQHPTKKGPGRVHGQGVSHGTAPVPPKGHFAGQHKNPQRAQRRAAIAKLGGIRQFKRVYRKWRDQRALERAAAKEVMTGQSA